MNACYSTFTALALTAFLLGGLQQETVLPLHPAFTITSDGVNAAIRRGEEAAKKGKNIAVLVDKYKRNPKWVRGKKGTVRESIVLCTSLEGTMISLLAHRAASLYNKLDLPESLITNGGTLQWLDFGVSLTSIAKVHRSAADETDVRVLKFVLSDDKGNNYESEPGAENGKESSGSQIFSGVSVVPNIVRTDSTARSTGSAFGSGGYVQGRATTYGTSVSRFNSYVPWSETHPYVQVSYQVRFSVFEKDGRPRFGPDVKEITLRIIMANGEQDVVYRLPDAKAKSRK